MKKIKIKIFEKLFFFQKVDFLMKNFEHKKSKIFRRKFAEKYVFSPQGGLKKI